MEATLRKRVISFVKRQKKDLSNSGLPLTIREMQMILRHNLMPMMLTSLIAGVVLSILAPFSTGTFTLLGRLIYWVGLCMAGGIGAAAFEAVIGQFKRDGWLFSGAPWPNALWQSVGASLAVFMFLFFMHRPNGFMDYAISLFYIWVIAIVICSFGALLKGRSEVSPITDARPELYNRLKPALRSAEIYALSAEDHYVRVITSAGDDLVLMRLSDAVKEVAPLPGLAPHRSWWVAEAGVETVKRSDGKAVIRLKSSQGVPVSRNGAKALRDSGWL